MLKPKYPTPDAYTPATVRPTPVPGADQSDTASASARTPAGLGALAPKTPGAAVALAAGAVAGVLALASVAVSLLLAVAVTAVALSISAVVVLFLVRALRQEFGNR
ncbi:SpdD protein [Streptomyces sp. NPDC046876]|uniref:SpdD protein n=1 Tax=Streptomyces sp. NPDC046876 TaxID=3155616 RepID=UPI00340748F0